MFKLALPKFLHFDSRREDVLTNGLQSLSNRIGYEFDNWALLVQALKHRSYLSVSSEGRLSSNERLELLGDAVLGLVVTEYLYKKFPSKEEGELTVMKSLIVSRDIIARVAKSLGVGQYVLLNEAEEKAGGRDRSSIMADAFEAIIGAIYLDGGLEKAVNFIKDHLLVDIEQILSEEQHQNFKSLLLEYAQSKHWSSPEYLVSDEQGPNHNKLFTVEVRIDDQIMGEGQGNNKKQAEQKAAQMALQKLDVI